MLVRFLGFSMVSEVEAYSFDSYINTMKEGCYSFEDGEHERVIYFNNTHSPDYYVGLLVTIKDQRTYCKLVNESGKLHVEVTALASDANLMDFNFFVINKATGTGLYQHYHQSCSINYFGALNAKKFAEMRGIHLERALKIASKGKNLSRKEDKAIRNQHRGHLNFEVLVRKENLKALIEELARVQEFEFSFAALTVDEPEFKPLQNHVRKERHSISFVQGSPVSVLANQITKIITAKDIEDGKITGIDASGVPRVFRIANNPDNFGEFDYDDVAPKINELDISKFESSWVVQELIKTCKAHRHIFETPIK